MVWIVNSNCLKIGRPHIKTLYSKNTEIIKVWILLNLFNQLNIYYTLYCFLFALQNSHGHSHPSSFLLTNFRVPLNLQQWMKFQLLTTCEWTRVICMLSRYMILWIHKIYNTSPTYQFIDELTSKIFTEFNMVKPWQTLVPTVKVKKVKQSLYTPWRRLGGEEV
jgi:hypothetical protein